MSTNPQPGGRTARIGLVARVNGIWGGRWMSADFAAKLVGVAPTRLARWAKAGLISSRRDEPGARHRYLRPELVIVSRLGVGGAPPDVHALRRHVRGQDDGSGEPA
ncbi:hypothetical protein [Actinomadura atramentaria]|uniref:hypothetical protein n=1 Tax=Actinomadura atramentaria TaxID=1990 RepID=UPI00038163B4|nr:hypothetical protein [Actinomadura atramentaria]